MPRGAQEEGGGYSGCWRIGAFEGSKRAPSPGRRGAHRSRGWPRRVSVCTSHPMGKVTKDYINSIWKNHQGFTLLKTESLDHVLKQRINQWRCWLKASGRMDRYSTNLTLTNSCRKADWIFTSLFVCLDRSYTPWYMTSKMKTHLQKRVHLCSQQHYS